MSIIFKKIFSNWGLVVIISILFAVWIFVFDRNSYLDVQELNARVKELEAERDFYRNKIAEDSAVIVGLKDSAYLEKFAREHYFMKAESETMYIVKISSRK